MRVSRLAAVSALVAVASMVALARHHDHVLALAALHEDAAPTREPERPAVERPELASIEALLAPIDLNTASTTELERLPRIGPALAARIVESRPFTRLEDLERVRGIGPRTIESLRPHVIVGPQ